MSFLVLPPEINSSLMFGGAGSTPMLAAAASWDGLAAELNSAAESFSSVTAGLTEQAWQGAAAAAMMQTATNYTSFLNAATAQAQAAAAQAQAVAGAFESAMSATVHPLAVAANRNSFVQLVMSNLFGQNAPAIAAAESDYEQMWAQDVAAMVGYHGGASAAAAALPSWSTALQGLSGQLSGLLAGSPGGPVGAAVTSLNSAATSGPLSNVGQAIISAINAPTEFLFGTPLIKTGPPAVLGGNGQTGTVPVTMYQGTEALVNGAVGTGSPVPLLVDTGSTGLVIPFQKVGGVFGLLQLGLPTGGGFSGYSGGLDYMYLTYNAPVNFGGGLVTGSAPVNVEIFAWPTSLSSALNSGFSFQNFFAADGASGVLGLGPNAGGPGTAIPTQYFAHSDFNQGVLINQTAQNPYIQFGTQQTTMGSQIPIATLQGAPITGLDVTVNGTNYGILPAEIDSGGVTGTLPFTPSTGDAINVYAPDGHTLLYQYNYGQNYTPLAGVSGYMNTGNLIFQQHPVYVSNSPAGGGTTIVY